MPVLVIEQPTTATTRTNFILRQHDRIFNRKWDVSSGPHPHDATAAKPGNFEKTYNVSVTRLQFPDLPDEWDDREHWQPLLIKRNGIDKSKRLLNYWHGGAFISRITPHHWKLLGRLAHELDADIVIQTYTMVPYAGIHIVISKLLALYQKVRDMAKENGQELVIGGDSAGGHITASVLLGLHDNGMALPDQAFMIAPALVLDYEKAENKAIEPYDAMLGINRMVHIFRAWAIGPIDAAKIYAPIQPATDDEKTKMEHPYAAPLNGDWTFMKEAKVPITIIQGTYDLLLPQVKQFVQKAKDLDLEMTYIEADRAPHVYPILAEVFGSSILAPDSEKGLKLLVKSILKYSKI